MQEMIH